MPNLHIVDRYFETVDHLGVKNDNKECEFYISPRNEVDVFTKYGLEKYLTVAIGAQFATKRLPTKKIIENARTPPTILLANSSDRLVYNLESSCPVEGRHKPSTWMVSLFIHNQFCSGFRNFVHLLFIGRFKPCVFILTHPVETSAV